MEGQRKLCVNLLIIDSKRSLSYIGVGAGLWIVCVCILLGPWIINSINRELGIRTGL